MGEVGWSQDLAFRVLEQYATADEQTRGNLAIAYRAAGRRTKK